MTQARPRRTTMMEQLQQQQEPPPQADYFKLKVQTQQFMNENGALFSALALNGGEPKEALASNTLAAAIAKATTIATEIARRFTGNATPMATQIKPFRLAASAIVAQAIEQGIEPDVEGVAQMHTEAFRLLSDSLDTSSYPDVSGEASLAMTAANVAATLIKPVMTYDFRRDPVIILNELSRVVMAAASETAAGVIPPDGKDIDRQSVLQTTANKLAAIMSSVYERKVRQVLAHISPMLEDDRQSFCEGFDPLPEIIQGFREWAVVFGGSALVCARGAAGSTRPETAPSIG